MISKAESTGATTYEYDYENRLKKATMPDGTIAEFKYDAMGRRIEKKITTVIASPSANNNGGADEAISTTRYLYDGYNIMAEYDGDNNIKTRYTHSLAIDDVLAMERGGEIYYYHKDALGTITAMTDVNGQIAQSYEYDAFGNIVLMLDENFVQPYAFTGREWDRETGLYYYRARYYDARAGRFITKDPIGFAGGVNLYGYVGNNPVNRIDPMGLSDIIEFIKNFTWQFASGLCLAPAPIPVEVLDPEIANAAIAEMKRNQELYELDCAAGYCGPASPAYDTKRWKDGERIH